MSDFHRCPAPGCQKRVPDDRLTCPGHWYALPKAMRAEVVCSARDFGNGSVAHSLAVDKAIKFMVRNATRHEPRWAR